MNKRKFTVSLLSATAALALLGSLQIGHSADLSVSFSPLAPGSTVDLSTQGEMDWAHWGFTDANSFDHKDFVTPFISNYNVVGTNSVQQVTNIGIGYSWSDGTPTAFADNSATAVRVTGTSDGFQIQVPADTVARRLKLYVGVYAAQGKLDVTLSGGGASPVTDNSLNVLSAETNGVYTIDFTAASAGQILTVQFTVQTAHDVNGDVRLHAAALQFNSPPLISLNSPANEALFASPANVSFEASADDFDVNGFIQKVDFFTNNVLLATVTNSPYTFLWVGSPPGAYDVFARATAADGEVADSESVTIFVYTNSGSLAASVASAPTAINLTSEGTSDWAHWGLRRETSYDHKSGIVPQIGNHTTVGSGQVFQQEDSAYDFTWTDGAPNITATNTTTGVFILEEGNGFEFTVRADDTLRTLKVYLGVFFARGKLRAHLSDGTAAPVFDTSVENAGGATSAAYTLQFRAGSSNQLLHVRFVTDHAYSTFSGNVALQAATLVTDNLPPQAAITNLTSHSVFSSPTNILIQADASDADGTISKVEFLDGAIKLGEATTAPYQFTLTNAPGGHRLSVRATDNRGITFASAPIEIFVTTGGGSLTGNFFTPISSVNLTTEGRADWAHWGLGNGNNMFNHRNINPHRISDVTKIGTGPLKRLSDYSIGFGWNNGTPTATVANTMNGIYLEGQNNGFQVTAPADTIKRRLTIYLGAFAASGRFEASLSDASAAWYVNTSVSNLFDNIYGVYTLDYAAASTNQMLTLKFIASDVYDLEYGNVTWEAATLALTDLNFRIAPQSGGNVQLSFLTDPDTDYSIVYSDLLPAAAWTPLTNIIGNGSVTNILTPANTPQRFFRAKAGL